MLLQSRKQMCDDGWVHVAIMTCGDSWGKLPVKKLVARGACYLLWSADERRLRGIARDEYNIGAGLRIVHVTERNEEI